MIDNEKWWNRERFKHVTRPYTQSDVENLRGDSSKAKKMLGWKPRHDIDDLVEGLILLMNSVIQKPVNLGNPVEFTMIELAEEILKITQSESGYVLNELPEDDPQRRCPDIRLAKENLSWHPKISLAEGLSPTLDWFKKRLNM